MGTFSKIIADMDKAIRGLSEVIGEQAVPKGASIAFGCKRHFICTCCGCRAKTSKRRPSKLLCWRCREQASNTQGNARHEVASR